MKSEKQQNKENRAQPQDPAEGLSSTAASISEQLVDHTKVFIYDMNVLVSNKMREFMQDLRNGSNTVFCERIKEQEDFMFKVVNQHTEEVVNKTQKALDLLKEDVEETCAKMQTGQHPNIIRHLRASQDESMNIN